MATSGEGRPSSEPGADSDTGGASSSNRGAALNDLILWLLRDGRVANLVALAVANALVAGGIRSVEALHAAKADRIRACLPDAGMRRVVGRALSRSRKQQQDRAEKGNTESVVCQKNECMENGDCQREDGAEKRGAENVGFQGKESAENGDAQKRERTENGAEEGVVRSAKRRRKAQDGGRKADGPPKGTGDRGPIRVNRSPVLILWAAVAGERLGMDWSEALSVGGGVASVCAQAKGRRLGLKHGGEGPIDGSQGQGQAQIRILGIEIVVRETGEGLRAVDGDGVVQPRYVYDRLRRAFGERFGDVYEVMMGLAGALDSGELEGRRGFEMYERFRPGVPEGRAGWGAAGELSLEEVGRMAGEQEGRMLEEAEGRVAAAVASRKDGATVGEVAVEVRMDVGVVGRCLEGLQARGEVYCSQDRFMVL
ncbi:unnamed protein product [Ostreobium quekettii]|uniref:Uncharacterized protein n=1 Tax=Ostreobium quekettii TaxID=121088 RepID=A0A8S1IQG0_9CHLO|nr:unnamed protein product [Ostreobium quekettii]